MSAALTTLTACHRRGCLSTPTSLHCAVTGSKERMESWS